MSNLSGDGALANLRVAVEAMEIAMAAETVPAGVRTAWTEVVRVMALGPAPQMRNCPKCAAVGFRGATRCSTCWASFEALAPLPDSDVKGATGVSV